MKRVFLVMVVSALLVTLGFGQTPDAGSNPDPAKPAAATVIPPAVDAAAPAATVSPSAATVSTPAADATRRTRPSAHPRRLSATQAATATAPPATVSPSSETVGTSAVDAATPAATASPSAEPVSTTAPAATTTTATHRGGSLWLLISFLVLVIVLGTLTPLFGKWRKRKALERTGTPNLSFTNEASSDPEKPETRKVA